MRLAELERDELAGNRLQARKSSFQAWKVASFGGSLLVLVLLLSKLHEVSTDLSLLQGIERLLSNGTPLNGPANSTGGREAVAPANSTSDLASYLITSDLNGHELLRAEVDAFTAEIKGSKSTLILSSLLVFVYLISWTLMSLAISDARISKDSSLRNILLLTVFAVIDISASIGFVIVRLMMYSMKSSSFSRQVLSMATFEGLPVQLTGDQLTAFTALRLVAMRSCSAFVDLYVSTLVVLLVILRFYASLRGLNYYKRLRSCSAASESSLGGSRAQLADSLAAAMCSLSPNYAQNHQLQPQQPSQLQLQLQTGAFSPTTTTTTTALPRPTTGHFEAFRQPHSKGASGSDIANQRRGSYYSGQQFCKPGEQHLLVASGRQRPASSQLVMQPDANMAPASFVLLAADRPAVAPPRRRNSSQTNPILDMSSNCFDYHSSDGLACKPRRASSQDMQQVLAGTSNKYLYAAAITGAKTSTMVSGRRRPASRLTSHELASLVSAAEGAKAAKMGAVAAPAMDSDAGQHHSLQAQERAWRPTRASSQQPAAGFELVEGRKSRRDAHLAASSGGQHGQQQIYTLMRADRLDRRLLVSNDKQQAEAAASSSPTGSERAAVANKQQEHREAAALAATTTSSKYKLVAQYRQLRSLDSTATTLRSTNNDSCSSTSCGPDESDGELARGVMLAGLRQSEELVASQHPNRKQHQQQHQQAGSDSSQLIMGKYYYCA